MQEPQQQQREQIPGRAGVLMDILDRLFKDAVTGEIVFYRAILLILIFLMGFVWYSKSEIFALYKETRFENYQEILQAERDRKFGMVAQEQLQIVHVSSRSDFSVVFSFRPRNMNYFVDMIATEGKTPTDLIGKEKGGYPINKISNEYMVHMSGRHFNNARDFAYLPAGHDEFEYMYSCPIVNLDNIYAGSVSMFWKKKPVLTEAKLFVICNQAERLLSRAR
ncbi:holin lysis mediator [Aeromonas phage Asfd_1]|nr:holin lysis mediator [Aeromonas phage Asfd_1]